MSRGMRGASHGLKPHRIERSMASNDPDFESNAADIIRLDLNPPAAAEALHFTNI